MPGLSTSTVTANDLSARTVQRGLAPKNIRKLAALVNGFGSTETESAVARLVTALWIVPALALAGTGLLGLLGGFSESLGEWMVTIVGATSLLSIFSVAVGLWWLLKVWANARRLGRAPVLRLIDTLGQHGVMFVAGVICAAAGTVLVPLLYLGILLLIGSSMLVPRLARRLIDELWATSSPYLGSESHTNLSIAWVAAYLVTGAAWGSVEAAVSAGRFAPLVATVAGVGMLVWIGVTIRIIGAVSQRQDERLRAIVQGVQVAADVTAPRPVTERDVAEAWQSSAEIVGFPGL